MAQPPHKPEPHKPPEVKPEAKPEMNVPMPGAPPKESTGDQQSELLPETTMAEQEAGKKAQEYYAQRLKDEQEAGKKAVEHNTKASGGKAPEKKEENSQE